VSYVIPLQPLEGSKLTLNGRHESKDLTFEDVELKEGGETRIETNLLSVTWQYPYRLWGGFQVKPQMGLVLLNENYDVFEVLFGNLSSSVQQSIIDQIGRQAYDTLKPDFQAVIPTLGLQMRRSDGRLFINNGDSLDLELLGASEAAGSNLSFWQLRLSSWHIRSFGDASRLLLRTSMGYSDANSNDVLGVNFNEMPEYYEFRAGGALSVRGYEFESLYPSDSITGGKSELVGSIEYDYEVIPDWSVAVFVDAGNAFNEWDDYDAKVGAGFGLRWRSPVGLARIDVGFPLDDSNELLQVYITVGPEF
jgi:translocation and assembly module TamA